MGEALADLLVSLYEDTKGRRAGRFPFSSAQRKQLQKPGQAFSSPLSARAVAMASSFQTVRSQLLLFKPQELLKWRPCLCSGHVFLPRILGDQQRNSGEKVVSGNWGLETTALVRTNEWTC